MIRTTVLAVLVAVGFGFDAQAQEVTPVTPANVGVQEVVPEAPATPKAPGQELAETVCVACHGATGTSAVSMYPHLAGQGADYLAKQIKDFKAERRNDPSMAAMMPLVPDGEELNLGKWFSQQIVVQPAAATQAGLIERGRQLWRAGDVAKGVPACSGCHGPSGQGLPAQYPRLAGQFPEYLVAQLQKFRSGERANDPENMMRAIAERLSDTDVKAASEYAAGLR
jgi:cytochrome c553